MIHRHIRTCAIPLLFAGVFSSCKKEFLDDRLLGQSTVQTNPDLAADLVTGAYNTLMISDTWGPPGDIHGFAFTELHGGAPAELDVVSVHRNSGANSDVAVLE